MTQRLDKLRNWLENSLQLPAQEPVPLTNDASFRSYYRINTAKGSQIVMDAPPEREKLGPFLDIAQRLRAAGLNAPEIHAINESEGFLLLDDLGDELFLAALQQARQAGDSACLERLYGDALSTLAVMQVCTDSSGLPDYDAALLHREMMLFPEWLLERHLQIELNDTEREALEQCFKLLIDSALEQPQIFVHRDYHSRNLLVHAHNPALLDFQDAVRGAVTYDLVSLLRDAYIRLPDSWVDERVKGYYELACQSGIVDPEQIDEAGFLRWFDWMGLQRHIKVTGIFARLYHRDGKAAYLNDIPLVLDYLLTVSARYPEMRFLHQLLTQRVGPAFAND